MLQKLLFPFRDSAEELARQVQARGLAGSAHLIAGSLRKDPPSSLEMPVWIEEVFGLLLETLCDYEAPLPSVHQCGALEASLRFVQGMPPETREEFQSLLVLLEVAPYVFGPRRRFFSRLSREERACHLQGWESAQLAARKGAFRAMKSVAMMGYWSRPETFEHLGYSVATNPGVPTEKAQVWKGLEELAKENR